VVKNNINAIKKTLKPVVNALKKKINIKKIYLFGSYSKGNFSEYSDIDLAIVSDNFQGIPFYDREKINKIIIFINNNIEVHPFRSEDFTDDDPFVKEIIKTGIELS
jgi:predicted nucleotidyltransferase